MNEGTVIHNPGNRGEALRVLAAGVLGMVIAMAIGRFAFTPILPVMQRELGMSNALAGQLAGINYAGYLLGALGCALWPRLLRVRGVYALSLILSLLTTSLMGLFDSSLWWGALRFFSGIASALVFIHVSTFGLERLTRLGHARWAGALHGGVGLGIALSGLAVPMLGGFTGWAGVWAGMGILGMLLAAVALILTPRQGGGNASAPKEKRKSPGGRTPLGRLCTAYFFEGLGYVISGTFLVTIVAATRGLEAIAPYCWVVVGLMAAPSTLVWPAVGRRFGIRRALIAAYALQLSGLLVSLGAQSLPAVLYAAASFGGTFMGIVILSVNEGIRRARGDRARIASILTLCFGVGQVLGPPVAGWFADRSQGFTASLLMASAAVLLGLVCTLADREFER